MDPFTTPNIFSPQLQEYQDYSIVADGPIQTNNVSFKDNINLYLKLGNSLPKSFNGLANFDVVPKTRMSSLSWSTSESTSDSSSPTPFVVFDSENFNQDLMEDCDCSKGIQEPVEDLHHQIAQPGREISDYPSSQLQMHYNYQQPVQSQAHPYFASSNGFGEGLMDPINTAAIMSENYMDGYVDNTSHNHNIGDYSHFIEPVVIPDSNNDVPNSRSAVREVPNHGIKTDSSDAYSSSHLSITNAIKLATNAISNSSTKKFESITEKLLHRFPKPLLGKKFSNNSTLKCFHCNKLFYNHWDLSTHIDQNKLIRAHKCPIYNCPFNLIGFEKKAILRHHLISQHFRKGYLHSDYHQHSNEIYSLIYRCGENNCGKCFYRKDSLSRHIKLVHNNKSSKFNRKIEKEKVSRSKRRNIV